MTAHSVSAAVACHEDRASVLKSESHSETVLALELLCELLFEVVSEAEIWALRGAATSPLDSCNSKHYVKGHCKHSCWHMPSVTNCYHTFAVRRQQTVIGPFCKGGVFMPYFKKGTAISGSMQYSGLVSPKMKKRTPAEPWTSPDILHHCSFDSILG